MCSNQLACMTQHCRAFCISQSASAFCACYTHLQSCQSFCCLGWRQFWAHFVARFWDASQSRAKQPAQQHCNSPDDTLANMANNTTLNMDVCCSLFPASSVADAGGQMMRRLLGRGLRGRGLIATVVSHRMVIHQVMKAQQRPGGHASTWN